MKSSRRLFLKSSGLAVFGITSGIIPSWMQSAVKATNLMNPDKKKILICIFQRGAMDGLMAVSPYRDEYFKSSRPGLYIEPSASLGSIELDDRWSLHPGLSLFHSIFQQKDLAIVHGIGLPNNTRSHFDAQDYMESGTPYTKNTSTGWLGRASSLIPDAENHFKSISLTSNLPKSLYGDPHAVAISDLHDFKLISDQNNHTRNGFESLYSSASQSLMNETGQESFEALKIIQASANKRYSPENNARYPSSQLGNSLRQIAQLIKMKIGLEIAFAESIGWDTHFNQGSVNGIFARNAKDFSESIAALWADLGDLQDHVTILTMTEFGRTVKQNGTGGTDHGRGSCNFIIGKNILGGKVYHQIESLSPEVLEDGRDLPVTIDYRSVLNEVVTKQLNINNKEILFPGWNGRETGIMK